MKATFPLIVIKDADLIFPGQKIRIPLD